MFMMVTAVISVVCFNFNKILHFVLSLVCDNIYDESVPVFGPYMNVKPIILELAMVDQQVCTNKMNLLMNWYWNTDIGGITTSDILVKGNNIAIQYRKKYSECPSKVYKCIINIENQKITQGDKTTDILFEELKMI